jgi:pyrimidine deaminase RibD-like protein
MVSLPEGAVGKISVEVEPSVDVVIRPDGSLIVARAEWREKVTTRHTELYAVGQAIGVAKLADALAKYGYEVER